MKPTSLSHIGTVLLAPLLSAVSSLVAIVAWGWIQHAREGGGPLTFDPERIVHTVATMSPWDRALQHGGPPTALLATAIEEFEPKADMRTARITVDFMGTHLFVPPSINVTLLRYPTSEWIFMRAKTIVASDGIGLTEAHLYDETSLVAVVSQPLLVALR